MFNIMACRHVTSAFSTVYANALLNNRSTAKKLLNCKRLAIGILPISAITEAKYHVSQENLWVWPEDSPASCL